VSRRFDDVRLDCRGRTVGTGGGDQDLTGTIWDGVVVVGRIRWWCRLGSRLGMADVGCKGVVLTKFGISASGSNSIANAYTFELFADAKEVGGVAFAVGDAGKDDGLSAVGEAFDRYNDTIRRHRLCQTDEAGDSQHGRQDAGGGTHLVVGVRGTCWIGRRAWNEGGARDDRSRRRFWISITADRTSGGDLK
jgi:hypothetical protein